MEKSKLLRSRKSQGQFVFLVILAGLGLILVSSNFILFNEIKDKNRKVSQKNKMILLGEEIASSINEVYIAGQNTEYNGSEGKLLINSSMSIPSEYSEYTINASQQSIVITHEDKEKEIKLHNLNNTLVKGLIRGKKEITISYYKNQTRRRIELL